MLGTDELLNEVDRLESEKKSLIELVRAVADVDSDNLDIMISDCLESR